ncbi:MAG: hypothetical protein J7L41_01285 [Synergistetes bacterium]|nr:hypothetical protein [Synergistota bacterium]
MKRWVATVGVSVLIVLIVAGTSVAEVWGFYAPQKGGYFAHVDLTPESFNHSFSFYVNLIKFDNLHAFELSTNSEKTDALFERYANVVGAGINTKMLSLGASKDMGNKFMLSGELGFADANISNGTSFMFGFGMAYYYKPGTTFRFSFEQVDKEKKVGIKVYIDF